MIEFRLFETPPFTQDTMPAFTDGVWWGTIKDGQITDFDPEVSADEYDNFEHFIAEKGQKLLNGWIDPLAVVKEHRATIVAAVPDVNDPDTYYWDVDIPRDPEIAANIKQHGDLGTVETHELNKYQNVETHKEDPDSPIFKEYELNAPYETLIVSAYNQSEQEYVEVGRINQSKQTITGEDSEQLKSLVNPVRREAPSLNPVGALLHGNTGRARQITAIDPDTSERYTSPRDVKKPPGEIVADVK